MGFKVLIKLLNLISLTYENHGEKHSYNLHVGLTKDSVIDKNVNKKSIKIPVFPSKQEHACGMIQALL